MRTNVRIGNDIKLLWEVLRGGQPVNLNDATHMAVSIMQGGVLDCNEATPITTFAVDPAQNNLLVVEIQADKITELGYLWVKLEYTMSDGGMIDGNRKITIDNLPVKIVGLTDEAGDVYEFNVTTDVVVGFDGKSAYEVWLVENPDKTLQDYFDWLQQPATDIATEVSQAEALRVQAETLRVQAEGARVSAESGRAIAEGVRVSAESGRVTAEQNRVTAESGRAIAEGVRVSAESGRVTAEQNRVTAESARVSAEQNRVTAEQNRATAEGERVTAEQDRVDAEVIREQQETDRQTNTDTAIADAEGATINANGAAYAANTAAATIDAKIATKAEQADLLQLAGEVSQIEVKDAVQSAKIRDIESIISTMNPNQSAQINVSGVSPLSLPKNAANSGMSVKLEGLTEDVGGVITNFEPTGRVRSVGKNLFRNLTQTISANGLTFEINNDHLKINGSTTTGSVFRVKISNGIDASGGFKESWHEERLQLIDGDPYRLSMRQISGTYSSGQNSALRLATSISQNIGSINFPDGSLSSSSPQRACLYLLIYPNTTFNHYEFAIQLEKGSISTPFEPYRETSLYLTAPELRSNGDVKDEIRKVANGYELVKRISDVDGSVLTTPEIIPISYGGVLNSAENGTVYHEPIIADAGVYDTKMDILLTDYPIASIEEIIKHENGVDTYLNVASAVVASDALSFTHPDLVDGDLVLFTYAFDKESTNGNITATFYDSNVVKIDTVTGKAYKINEVVTNGVLTRTIAEV